MADRQTDAYLVDASVYVFRAWFSLPDTLTGSDDAPVNAVYGFVRFLTEFMERVAPTHLAVAFDGSLASSFRNELYPDYKANRELPPPELERQFDACRAFVRALGIPCFCDERFEADDLIATLARMLRVQGFRNVVLTSDKDLAQILDGDDLWWDYARDRRFVSGDVVRHFGVKPKQMRDYLALVGDAVDNIPGVPGIGAKTAVRLLRVYADLEAVYDNLDQVSQLALRGARRIAANLAAHREQVFLSRQLATVVADVPLKAGDDGMRIGARDDAALDDLVKWMNRGHGFVERLRALPAK